MTTGHTIAMSPAFAAPYGKDEILEVLVRGRKELTDKEAWTQVHRARRQGGQGVDPCSPSAVCFCSQGKLFQILGYSAKNAFNRLKTCDTLDVGLYRLKAVEDLLTEAAKSLGSPGYVHLNDRLGHECTLVMWDTAIELRRKQLAPKDPSC